eukprot:4340346-Pleurochrysis_carterae.AAC.2
MQYYCSRLTWAFILARGVITTTTTTTTTATSEKAGSRDALRPEHTFRQNHVKLAAAGVSVAAARRARPLVRGSRAGNAPKTVRRTQRKREQAAEGVLQALQLNTLSARVGHTQGSQALGSLIGHGPQRERR